MSRTTPRPHTMPTFQGITAISDWRICVADASTRDPNCSICALTFFITAINASKLYPTVFSTISCIVDAALLVDNARLTLPLLLLLEGPRAHEKAGVAATPARSDQHRFVSRWSSAPRRALADSGPPDANIHPRPRVIASNAPKRDTPLSTVPEVPQECLPAPPGATACATALLTRLRTLGLR